MNKSKLTAIIILSVVLLIACTGLAFWSYTIYKTKKLEAEQLEAGLEETTSLLKEAKTQLQKQNQEYTSLTEKNRDLNKEIVSLKESIAEMEESKDALDKQSKRLSKEKERLEKGLAEVMLLAKEQISLKEKDFREKLDAEEEKFQMQKKVLTKAITKQIKASEVMLKNLNKENEKLTAQLKKNKEMLAELQKDELATNLQKMQLHLKEKEADLNRMIEQNEMFVKEFNKNKTEKDQIASQLKQTREELEKEIMKLHYNLGLVYDQGRRYKEAAAEYEKALKIVWDDPDIHYNLGIIYDEHIYDKKKALKHYQAYLELCPGAPDADKVARWVEQVKRGLEFQ